MLCFLLISCLHYVVLFYIHQTFGPDTTANAIALALQQGSQPRNDPQLGKPSELCMSSERNVWFIHCDMVTINTGTNKSPSAVQIPNPTTDTISR